MKKSLGKGWREEGRGREGSRENIELNKNNLKKFTFTETTYNGA